ncbi:MAG: DNA gyrase inhibitor YacG [Burkholderia sp.]|jgi:uncharacterized protein
MKVKCPTCGRETEYSPKNPWRPFCSERCKLIDLGAWADDRYVIQGAPGSADRMEPEDLEEAARYTQERAERKAAETASKGKGRRRR